MRLAVREVGARPALAATRSLPWLEGTRTGNRDLPPAGSAIATLAEGSDHPCRQNAIVRSVKALEDSLEWSSLARWQSFVNLQRPPPGCPPTFAVTTLVQVVCLH